MTVKPKTPRPTEHMLFAQELDSCAVRSCFDCKSYSVDAISRMTASQLTHLQIRFAV